MTSLLLTALIRLIWIDDIIAFLAAFASSCSRLGFTWLERERCLFVVVERPPSNESDRPALGLEAPEQLDEGRDIEFELEPKMLSADGLLYVSGAEAGNLYDY